MHLTESQFNDFVDDTLASGERDAVHAHIAACAECRAEAEAMQSLLQRVATLPKSIEPMRDLRPQMWAKADHRGLWQWRYPLAAAAILLIAVSSVITLFLSRQPDGGPTARIEVPTGRVDLVSIEQQYTTELEQLQRLLRDNREELAPETVQILEENLRIIDTAINEARTALTKDPNSHTLGELLKSAYQRKVELLKQAARTSAAT